MKCKNTQCVNNITTQEDQTTGLCLLTEDTVITLSELGTCEQMELIPFTPPNEEYEEYLEEFEDKLSKVELTSDQIYEMTR